MRYRILNDGSIKSRIVTKLPMWAEWCIICKAYHHKRWHQAVWRHETWESDIKLTQVFRQEPT